MYEGTIKTKDVLLHPITLMKMRGFFGYLKLLVRALSPRKYHFVDNIEKTGWYDMRDEEKK